ncbi:fibronectin type III domain-containing protein [uncultured Aquimarina sp.]|uniref:fibronectin type III domain-containing protein n=1 Tax=uncultured Aquimarina sp. TaxID=575652 RepID=UPI002635AB6D|nr:fibronectin type III domain-containing protein [uncultured Aquimarina sp.]
MKNIYILILSVFALSSCSDEEFDVIEVDSLNIEVIPSIPRLIYPTNNLVCTNFDLDFEWTPSTSDISNAFIYIIEIATDDTFSNIVFKTNTSQSTRSFNLEKGTTYFWRVKAFDTRGYESRYTGTQTFFTEPEAGINNIPYPPQVVFPISGASLSGTATTLDWNTADSDGDPLLFDVYFGESNPPQLVAENIDASTFDVAILANKTYYWRVVAKDNNQGVAIGRVWNFKTN